MDEHTKLFEKDIGTWEGDVTVTPFPGAPAQTSRGVMTNRLVGGRWLVADFKNDSGFEGHGIYGWDATKQRYVSTWIDSMRNAMVIADGTLDLPNRTMTYAFEISHGGRTIKCRDVTTFPEEGTQVFRSFIEIEPGKEHQVVSATYRKRA